LFPVLPPFISNHASFPGYETANEKVVTMTELLQKAFREAAKLSPEDQDALASLLLAELESERRWEKKFARSEDALVKLADEALRDDDAGHTEDLIPEEL
jgi:hypothetical protein